MTDPEVIYLQPECCADPEVGRLWCEDDAPEDCEDGKPWTKYVLAARAAPARDQEALMALNIARYMQERFYPEAKDFEPLNDLMGLLTQISNMATGLARAAPAQDVKIQRIAQRNSNLNKRPTYQKPAAPPAPPGSPFRAAPAQPAGKTALERFNELKVAQDESDPVEQLRAFCSLAMTGQDWLDVEPFFDAVLAARAAQAQRQALQAADRNPHQRGLTTRAVQRRSPRTCR